MTTENGLVQSTVLRWREGSRAVGADSPRRTTFVAKIAARWVPGGRALPIAPEPLVPYDERSTDPLRVSRAGELAPISSCAAVLVSGGPARVTIIGALGPRVVESSPAVGVGASMASPERGRFARAAPSRGEDGLLVIPEDLDARFFHAAPEAQHLPLLRGSEPITIQSGSSRVDTSLPGLVAVATVRGEGGEERRLLLGPDMIVVDVARGQLSLVGRASVRGAFELVTLVVVPIESAGTVDRGDPRKARSDSRALPFAVGKPASSALGETAPISASMIAQVRARAATPFPRREEPAALIRNASPTGRPAGSAPATPFEGFRAAPVQPGRGLDRTFTEGAALRPVVLPPPQSPPPPPRAAATSTGACAAASAYAAAAGHAGANATGR